jgi:hypothetical protein
MVSMESTVANDVDIALLREKFKSIIVKIKTAPPECQDFKELVKKEIEEILNIDSSLNKIVDMFTSQEFVEALNRNEKSRILELVYQSINIGSPTKLKPVGLWDSFVLVDSNLVIEANAVVGEDVLVGTKAAVAAVAVLKASAAVWG